MIPPVRRSVWLVLVLALASPALADEEGRDVPRVPGLTVTATRTPREVESLTGSADVVDREELDLKDAWSVEEALSEYPGVDVVGSSRYGQEVRLNTRGLPSGFGTQRTLVMLDGRPLTDEFLGHVDLAQYPLGGLERVELVRGPASSVYGTNALGGALNLIPRRGTAEWRTDLVAEGGSFGTRRIALSHGRMIGDIDFFLSMEGTSTNGYMNNTRGEDMDWETKSTFANVGYADERWDVRAYLALFTGEGTDLEFDRDIRRDLEDVSIAYRSDPDRDAETKLRVYRSGLDETLFWFDSPDSMFEQASLGAILTQSFRVREDHLLVAGGEWRHEQAEAEEALFTVDEREATWSAFLQDEWDVLDDLGIVVGGRYDKRSGVDREIGWRAGFNLRATEGTTVRGAVGRAYRFPTISDRLLPPTQAFGQTFEGNPDLEPETLLSAELGVDQRLHDRVRASVTGFTSRFEDFWDFIPDTDGVSRPLNIGEVRVHGVETSVSADLGSGFSAAASYTFTNAEYTKYDGMDPFGNPVDAEGNRVDDTVVHAGSLSVVYRHPDGHSARFGWQLFGNRYTDLENTREERLDGFDVADLQLVAALCREVAATFSVQNLFNSGYRTSTEFRQPGRAIFLGVRLTFGPR